MLLGDRYAELARKNNLPEFDLKEADALNFLAGDVQKLLMDRFDETSDSLDVLLQRLEAMSAGRAEGAAGSTGGN